MGVNSVGTATCRHFGAVYRLFTFFNRDMQGLCKVWRRRHERGCQARTPAERRKWARRYIALADESSITIDLTHPGMMDTQPAE